MNLCKSIFSNKTVEDIMSKNRRCKYILYILYLICIMPLGSSRVFTGKIELLQKLLDQITCFRDFHFHLMITFLVTRIISNGSLIKIKNSVV